VTEAVVAGAVAGAIAGAITALAIALFMRPRQGVRRRSFTSPRGPDAGIAMTHVAPSSSSGPGSHGMGPFDRFNDRAKRVLALAQDEAIRFNHNYIGTEHLLLGLMREDEGVAAQVLRSLGADLSKMRQQVERIIGRGEATTSPSEITLSPRTKRVIEFAIDEARKLGHSHVGTEHLLLGIVREGGSIANGVLDALGLKPEAIRQKILETLGRPSGGTASSQTFAGSGPFSRFNDGAKRVLALAQEEAIRLNHNYMGTEHLLLGLIREDGAASRVLVANGVDLAKSRTAVGFIVPLGEESADASQLTLSPRTKKIIELAIDEARKLGHTYVGGEHLLLALVREGEGIACGVIESLGVSLEKIRQDVLRTFGTGR
jgi:ATP-dependent Clp protease ATP-binding subunit ClpA